MRSPATTSSISRTERSWPIASGVIDCGKTTVSLSGSTGRTAGSSTSSGSASSGSSNGDVASSALHLDRDRARCAAVRRLVGHRQRHRHDPALVTRRRALGVDVLGERAPGARTGRTRSPSAGTRGPRPSGARRSPATTSERSPTTMLEASGSTPGSSITTVSSCGSSVWKLSTFGRKPARSAGEARHLPEVGEELLELVVQPVDVASRHAETVPSRYDPRMTAVRRIETLVGVSPLRRYYASRRC